MTIKTKICGLSLSRGEQPFAAIDAALDGGCDYVGLVFFAQSPRNVSLDVAAQLAVHARGRAGIVALVVDPQDDALAAIIEHVSPDVLQLHGQESPDRVASIRQCTGREVWKALAVENAADVTRAAAYTGVADMILFDAKAPKGSKLPGGNGVAFDWHLLKGVAARHPFILSGGLSAETVAEAIRISRPWAVDVSSGVESAPGVKDPGMIRRFLQAVNEATTAY